MKLSLLLLALVPAMTASQARAGHIFDEGANPDPPVPLLAGQGVEVTFEDIGNFSADAIFHLTLQFLAFSGQAEDDFSTGDILSFTMNGFSLVMDFDNPLPSTTANASFQVINELTTGDPGFLEYDDQVFTNNTFTLVLLAGDGLRFDGFTIADGIGTGTGINSAAFASHGDVFVVPEPGTLLFMGLGITSLVGTRRRSLRQ